MPVNNKAFCAHRFVLGLILGVLFCLISTATLAWSAVGHKLVADLAADLLTPGARAQSDELLKGKTLNEVSAWPDKIRSYRPETAPYHYVHIPLWAKSYVPERDSTRGKSVVTAIEEFHTVLSDRSRSFLERMEALQFLIHFVGDLHQPLHVADRETAGGNSILVTINGRPMSLHKAWDKMLRPDLSQEETRQMLDTLRAFRDKSDISPWQGGTPADWAWETFQDAGNAFQLPPEKILGDVYIQTFQPIIERNLVKAGVRLAWLLNTALK